MRKIAADRNYRMLKEGKGPIPMDLWGSFELTGVRNLFGFGGWEGWNLKEHHSEKVGPDGVLKATLVVEKQTAAGKKAEMKISYMEEGILGL